MAKNRQIEMLKVSVSALMGLFGVAGSAMGSLSYTVSNLGVIGADANSTGPGLNDISEVVGQIGSTLPYQAGYSTNGGGLTPFATSNGADGAANAVNSGGVAVGFYTSGANQLAFYSSGTNLNSLPTFGGQFTHATGVNGNSAAFEVVGQSDLSGGGSRAFYWSNTGTGSNPLKYLGPSSTDDGLGATGPSAVSVANGLNASNIIVGSATPYTPTGASPGQHAFVYNPGTSRMYELGVESGAGLGGSSSANAINSSGAIVGTTQTDVDSPSQAFIYQGYDFSKTTAISGSSGTDLVLSGGNYETLLGSLDGSGSSDALAINDNGVVVGFSSADGGSLEDAFIDDGSGMQDLNLAILDGLPAGWNLDEATGINSAGDITGIADDGTNQYAFLLTPNAVPEPGLLGVVFVGGGLLSLKRRRRSLGR